MLLLALALAAGLLPAGETEPLAARRVTDGAIHLDGSLNEPAWSAAPVASRFR